MVNIGDTVWAAGIMRPRGDAWLGFVSRDAVGVVASTATGELPAATGVRLVLEPTPDTARVFGTTMDGEMFRFDAGSGAPSTLLGPAPGGELIGAWRVSGGDLLAFGPVERSDVLTTLVWLDDSGVVVRTGVWASAWPDPEVRTAVSFERDELHTVVSASSTVITHTSIHGLGIGAAASPVNAALGEAVWLHDSDWVESGASFVRADSDSDEVQMLRFGGTVVVSPAQGFAGPAGVTLHTENVAQRWTGATNLRIEWASAGVPLPAAAPATFDGIKNQRVDAALEFQRPAPPALDAAPAVAVEPLHGTAEFDVSIGTPHLRYQPDEDFVGTDTLVWHACVDGRCGAPARVDIHITDPTGGDHDGDGVADDVDNCPELANPDQRDFDADGLGNACDDDSDDDGTPDADDCDPFDGSLDVAVPCYWDGDDDGLGADHTEAACCGELPTGWLAVGGDNCPAIANPGQEDTDNDGIGDACEAAPSDDLPDAGSDPTGGTTGDGRSGCALASRPGPPRGLPVGLVLLSPWLLSGRRSTRGARQRAC